MLHNVLFICFCITNYHNFGGLKQYIFNIAVFMGQGSEHDITEISA